MVWCIYSSAYESLYTDSNLAGRSVCSNCFPSEIYTHVPIYQMNFTIGRGNAIVRPSLCLSSCKRYGVRSHRSGRQYARWRTGSSERNTDKTVELVIPHLGSWGGGEVEAEVVAMRGAGVAAEGGLDV